MMKALFATVLLATTGAFALGCTDTPRESAPGPAAFTAEAAPDGASVFLRPQAGSAAQTERVIVDVVARGAADVHGAAFRVTWDPEALAFIESQSGAQWSKGVLALVKEASPGQLAVVWTEKGETSIDATGETVIGTLVFEARGRKGTPLVFKPERSQLVDKKGVQVAVTWRGGSIPAR